MTKDDLIISYWAIGPSYRRELKENLSKQPLDNDWFNIIILTDYPEDFVEFSSNKNILAVLDIAEQRKKYDWSFTLEPLAPAGPDEATYSIEFNKLRSENKKFSYSLHRFSLLWAAENGYSKIILLDSDVYFRDLEHATVNTQLWMDTFCKVNFGTMKSDEKIKLIPNRFIAVSNEVRKYNDIFADLLKDNFKDITIQAEIGDELFIGDGPVRLFNFEHSDELLQFFTVWNFVVQNLMSDTYFHLVMENNLMGPYVINDELTLSLISKFLNIRTDYNPTHGLAIYHNQFKTRHFALCNGNYKEANSLEEFLAINNITLDQINI